LGYTRIGVIIIMSILSSDHTGNQLRMKDYYKLLGVPEDASDDDIRKAFRRLAFKYHPDKNIGQEKEAEAKFKDINEAYGVLSDASKRRQYDMARKGVFAGARYGAPSPGFQYSSEDIFRDTFANRTTMDDLNRMFAQAGLRFDQEFLNRVFFNADNIIIRFYGFGEADPRRSTRSETAAKSDQSAVAPPHKPGFLERIAAKATMKIAGFAMRKLFGIQYQPPRPSLDQNQDLELSPSEAASGGEKEVIFYQGKKRKRLMVKIPAGIQPGTRIRLKGMGNREGKNSGDLYLRVKVKGQF
jgi:curved DNA-binding protein